LFLFPVLFSPDFNGMLSGSQNSVRIVTKEEFFHKLFVLFMYMFCLAKSKILVLFMYIFCLAKLKNFSAVYAYFCLVEMKIFCIPICCFFAIFICVEFCFLLLRFRQKNCKAKKAVDETTFRLTCF
jgi:hypothetical protein